LLSGEPLPAFREFQVTGLADTVVILISMGIVFLQAIWLNTIFTNANFLDDRTLVPAMVWILVTMLDRGFVVLGQPMLLSILVLLLLQILMDVRFNHATPQQSFQAGVIVGIASLIHPPLILFVPFLFAAIYNLNTQGVREYFIVVVGLLLPFFWGWSFFYLKDDSLFWLARMQEHVGLPVYTIDLYTAIRLGIVVLYAIGGFVMLFPLMQSASFKRKKNVRTLLIVLLGLAVSFGISSNWPLANIYLLMPPLAMLISILLLRIHKIKLAEAVFGIFVLSIITSLVLSIVL